MFPGRARETSKFHHLSRKRPSTDLEKNGGKDTGKGLRGFFGRAACQRQSQIPYPALGSAHTCSTTRRSRGKQMVYTGLSDLGTTLLHVWGSGGCEAPRKVHAAHGILNRHGIKCEEIQMATLCGLRPEF